MNNRRRSEIDGHQSCNPRETKVKTSVRDLPFKDGDILYMNACEKKNRVRKNENGEWEDVPNEFVWWLNDYSISNI